MLAYAANRPQPLERRPAPHALLGIIAVHVGLLAVVMSAKMDLPKVIKNAPLVIDLIHEDDPPPPLPMDLPSPPVPQPSRLDSPKPLIPTPTLDQPTVELGPVPLPNIAEMVRPLPNPEPTIKPVPIPMPVKQGPQLLTRAADLKPPYPAAKLASGEEAVLRLRLTIDASGRVTSVEPVGPADPAFVQAARKHLLARWRYRAASEDGRAVASSTVITLRFQLES